MIPGLTSKLSEGATVAAATLYPKYDILVVSGTTPVVNIVPSFGGGFSGILFLVPLAVFTWTAAGNIAIAGTAVVNRVVVMIYCKSTSKWYPSYIA